MWLAKQRQVSDDALKTYGVKYWASGDPNAQWEGELRVGRARAPALGAGQHSAALRRAGGCGPKRAGSGGASCAMTIGSLRRRLARQSGTCRARQDSAQRALPNASTLSLSLRGRRW